MMRTCKHCGAPLRVIDARSAHIDPQISGLRQTLTIWRRRECPNGHRLDTVEIALGPRLKYRVHPQWPTTRKEGTQ